MESIKRTQQYLALYNVNPIPRINGRYLPLIHHNLYTHNFDHFVAIYLNHQNITKPDFPGELRIEETRLLPSSDGYIGLAEYAKTIYGGAVIGELIRRHFNNNNEKRTFYVVEGFTESAHGETSPKGSKIFLPTKFPNSSHFKTGGQPIDKLAIIHHEFHHTALWHGFVEKEITIEDERLAVINAENPIRVMNGYEPRYVYYQSFSESTINIFTAKIKKGRFTVNKNDITELVESDHVDAL